VKLNTPTELLLAAIAGTLLYAVQQVGRPGKSTAVLYLLGIPVFFVTSLYMGQNAIDIRPNDVGSFNIRYGMTIIPLVAVGVGYLAANLARFRTPAFDWSGKVLAVAGIAAVCYAYMPSLQTPAATAVLHDAAARPSPAIREVADFLHDNYDGDLILAESFGSINTIQFYAGVPLRRYVTENVPEAFAKAEADPVDNVDWIVVRYGDSIDGMLSDPKFSSNYKVVFKNEYGEVLATNDRTSLAAIR